MSDWEYFPIAEETRPDMAVVFKPEERIDLERTIAEQVALLLSLYGEITTNRVYPVSATSEDEGVLYNLIELPEEELDDDTILSLTQIPPIRSDGWDTSPGVYCVLHATDEDEAIKYLTVHDSSHKVDHFVYDHKGEVVEMDVLQELYEALGVLTNSYLELPSDDPLDPTSFPILVDDPEPAYPTYRQIDLSQMSNYQPDMANFN